MKNKILLSIIVPVYNCKNYINDFLNSLPDATDKYELIFVIDKSPYGEEKIISKYISNKEINVKIIVNEENVGVSESRNVGLRNISDEATHVFHVDPDDVLKKDIPFNKLKIGKLLYFKKYIEMFQNCEVVENSINGVLNPFGASVDYWKYIAPVSIALKVNFISRNASDWYPTGWLFNNFDVKNIVFTDEPILKYRIRKESVSHTRSDESIIRTIKQRILAIDKGYVNQEFTIKWIALKEYFSLSKKGKNRIKKPKFSALLAPFVWLDYKFSSRNKKRKGKFIEFP